MQTVMLLSLIGKMIHFQTQSPITPPAYIIQKKKQPQVNIAVQSAIPILSGQDRSVIGILNPRVTEAIEARPLPFEGHHQQRNINTLNRHSRMGKESRPGGRYIPHPHGVLDKMPVLLDGWNIAQHDRKCDDKFFSGHGFGSWRIKIRDLCCRQDYPSQHPAGVNLMK